MKYSKYILFLFMILQFNVIYSQYIYEPFSNGSPSDMSIQKGTTTYKYCDKNYYNNKSTYIFKTNYFTKKKNSNICGGFNRAINNVVDNNMHIKDYSPSYKFYYSKPNYKNDKHSQIIGVEIVEEVEDRPIVGINKKDVHQGYKFGDLTLILTGNAYRSESGIVVTFEDYDAYINDPTYRELIDGGTVVTYSKAQDQFPEMFAPLDIDILVILFLAISGTVYIISKKKRIHQE